MYVMCVFVCVCVWVCMCDCVYVCVWVCVRLGCLQDIIIMTLSGEPASLR